jgi:hypothetical protein
MPAVTKQYREKAATAAMKRSEVTSYLPPAPVRCLADDVGTFVSSKHSGVVLAGLARDE